MLNLWGSRGGLNGLVGSASFWAPLGDSGAGAVNLTLARGTGSATYTGAGTKTTIGSTGLIIPVASGVARSYYDPTTLAYQGYLAEGARTNLCLQSQNLAVSWTLLGATQSAGGASPISSVNYQRLLADAGNTTHRAFQAVTLGAGAVTFSTFAKAGTVGWMGIGFGADAVTDGAFFNLTAGVVGTVSAGATATIKAYPNGYLCTVTRTNPSDFVQIEIHTADNQATVWNAAGTESIDVIGHQVEDAAFASSYIPTTTVAVARNADVLTYPFAGNALAAVGTAYAELATIWQGVPPTTFYAVSLSNGTGAIALLASTSATIFDGTNVVTKTALPDKFASSQKVASSWGGSGQLITGSGISAQSGAFDGDIGSTGIGVGCLLPGATGNELFGTLKNIRIWQTQFSAAQLQAITA